jgi:hypothetical protein
MTKGLKRSSNLSDVPNKEEALANLGLSIEDYRALRGIYPSLNIDFSLIGNIANSEGNYQSQIDGIATVLSGIVPSGFVNKSGNSLISGSWSNGGSMMVASGLPSGYAPSSDSLFSLSVENNEAVIVCSGLVIGSGISFNSLRAGNNVLNSGVAASGLGGYSLAPIFIAGTQYFVEVRSL